jgi:type I restriction enzyme M protein
MDINKLLGVTESYESPDKLMTIISHRTQREKLFDRFLGENNDPSFDWFHEYFEDEHSDRRVKKQDFTPNCISDLVVNILPENGAVYDPAAGTGGMLIRKWHHNPNNSFICHELSNRALPFLLFNLSIRNTNALVIHGNTLTGETRQIIAIRKSSVYSDITFTPKAKQFEADFILANPPFNLSDWNNGSLNDDPRWKYGLPPSGNANFAWLQHMIFHLSPNGKIGMVLANGSLSSQSGGEGEIRRKIVEDDLVEGIIAMPTQLFYTTQIPVSLWFISRNKKQKNKTLFIDTRKMGTMVNRRLREMTAGDITKIADTFQSFDNGTLEDVKGYCAAVTTAEIARQDYILTPGRYVGIEEQDDDGEPFGEKMTRLTGELSEMFKRSRKLEGEIRKRLGAIGYKI